MPHDEKLPVPLSVIVSQAVDERIELLKQPLQPRNNSTSIVPQLTIIGGGALAGDVNHLLGPFCDSVNFIESLSHMAPDDLPVGGAVLCLSDLEEPVFKWMDADKLRGFQTIFKQSSSVLWVTHGTRNGDPYSRMVIGLGRTIVLETLHLRLQFLDLDAEAPPDSTAIAESMIRFHLAENWKDDSTPLLHSIEPELYLDKDRRAFIPRLNNRQNDRYNSGRREIIKHIAFRQQPVELVPPKSQDAAWHLVEGNTMPEMKAVIDINVLYSVTQEVEVSRETFLYPVLGTRRDTSETVLALSPKQDSMFGSLRPSLSRLRIQQRIFSCSIQNSLPVPSSETSRLEQSSSYCDLPACSATQWIVLPQTREPESFILLMNLAQNGTIFTANPRKRKFRTG